MRFKRKRSDLDALCHTARLASPLLEKLTALFKVILQLMQRLEMEDSSACREYEEALHALERLQNTNEALASRAEKEAAPAQEAGPPEPAEAAAPAQGDGEAGAAPEPVAEESATAPQDGKDAPAPAKTPLPEAALARRVQLLFDRSASAESAQERAPVFSLFGSRRRHLPARDLPSVPRQPVSPAADIPSPPETSSGTPAGTPRPPVGPSAETSDQSPAKGFAAPPAPAPVETPAPVPFLARTGVSASPVPPMYKMQFSAAVSGPLLRGQEAVFHLFMTEKGFSRSVEELLQASPSGPLQAQGAAVRVSLQSPDLAVTSLSQLWTWQGEYQRFDFSFSLPEDSVKRQVLFQAVVYINEVIATRLKFLVNCAAPGLQLITPRRRDVLSAFLSYAGEDRARMTAVLKEMHKARPDLHVFSDVDSLRSGENWREVLPLEIARRDVFFLCWSRHAKDSFWVNWEWHCALKVKGVACIVPILLDNPDSCPPPKDLDNRHFNDHLLHIMDAMQNGT